MIDPEKFVLNASFVIIKLIKTICERVSLDISVESVIHTLRRTLNVMSTFRSAVKKRS